MVSTSTRNAGGPWFDSRSRHDRLLYAYSVNIILYINFSGNLCGLRNLIKHYKKACMYVALLDHYVYKRPYKFSAVT